MLPYLVALRECPSAQDWGLEIDGIDEVKNFHSGQRRRELDNSPAQGGTFTDSRICNEREKDLTIGQAAQGPGWRGNT